MMGGNFVIGIIVFAILVIVDFVVIAKGSGRIAEVAARFHLDAMPGKQMAIDADLSAGLIDEKAAKERRKALEDESGFFGAMDGASKFVRGDAVAGPGRVHQHRRRNHHRRRAATCSFPEAARTYTLLTVGDGLVTEIPAFIVSTVAVLPVSKAGLGGSVDKAVVDQQFFGHPQALGMSAGATLGAGDAAGIPILPFLALGGGAAARAISGVRVQVVPQSWRRLTRQQLRLRRQRPRARSTRERSPARS